MAEEQEETNGVDGEDGEGEGGSSKGGGGKKKLIIIIAGAVLLLIGAVAGAYFSGLLDPLLGGGSEAPAAEEKITKDQDEEASEDKGEDGADGDSSKEKAKESIEEGVEILEPGFFHDLPETTVNLKARGSKKRFLKLQLALELNSEEDVAIVDAAITRITDNFNVFLREMRVEDLEGSAGMYRVREELILRINGAIAPLKVRDVLFKEMLIQ